MASSPNLKMKPLWKRLFRSKTKEQSISEPSIHIQTELQPVFVRILVLVFYLLKITHTETHMHTHTDACTSTRTEPGRAVRNIWSLKGILLEIGRGNPAQETTYREVAVLTNSVYWACFHCPGGDPEKETNSTRWKAHWCFGLVFLKIITLNVARAWFEVSCPSVTHLLSAVTQLTEWKEHQGIGSKLAKGQETWNGHKWKVFRLKTSLQGEPYGNLREVAYKCLHKKQQKWSKKEPKHPSS